MPRKSSDLPDFSQLSLLEIERMTKDLERHRSRVSRQTAAQAKRNILLELKSRGLRLEDVFPELAGEGRAKKIAKARPKIEGIKRGTIYAHPDDAAQTWTGYGRRPAWFDQALGTGKTPEELMARSQASARPRARSKQTTKGRASGRSRAARPKPGKTKKRADRATARSRAKK